MTFKELIDSTNTIMSELSKAIHVDAKILSLWYKHGQKPPKFFQKDIDRYFGRKIDLEYEPMFLPICEHKGCYNEYNGKCMLLKNTLSYKEECPFFTMDQ